MKLFWTIAKKLFFNPDSEDLDVSLLEESILSGRSMAFHKYKRQLEKTTHEVSDNQHTIKIQAQKPQLALAYTIAFIKCYRCNEIDKHFHKTASKRGTKFEQEIVYYMNKIGFEKPLYGDLTKLPIEQQGLDYDYAVENNIKAEGMLLSVIHALHKKVSEPEFQEYLQKKYNLSYKVVEYATDIRYGLNNLVNSVSKTAVQSTKQSILSNQKDGSTQFLSLIELLFISKTYNAKYETAKYMHERSLDAYLKKKAELEGVVDSIEGFFGCRYSSVINLFTKESRKDWTNQFPLLGKYFSYCNWATLTDKKLHEHAQQSKYAKHWIECIDKVKDYNKKYSIADVLECFMLNVLPKKATNASERKRVFNIVRDVFTLIEPYITDDKFLKSSKVPMIYQTHVPVRPNSKQGVGAEGVNGMIYLDLDLKFAEVIQPVIKRVGDDTKVKKEFAKRVLKELHKKLSNSYCEPYLLSKLSMSGTGVHVLFKYLQPLPSHMDNGAGILPRLRNKDADSMLLLQELGYAHAFTVCMEVLKSIELDDFFGQSIKIDEGSLGGLVKMGGGDTIMDGSMRKIEQGIALCYTPEMYINNNFRQVFVLSAIPMCYVSEGVDNWGAVKKRIDHNLPRLNKEFDNYQYILSGDENLQYLVETSEGQTRLSSKRIRELRNSGHKVISKLNRVRRAFDSDMFDNIVFDLMKVDVSKLVPINYDDWNFWGKNDFKYHMKRLKVGTLLKSLVYSQYKISCSPTPTKEDLEILGGNEPLVLWEKIRSKYLDIMRVLCSVSQKKSKYNSHEWESHLFNGAECPWNNSELTTSSITKDGLDMFKASGLYFYQKEEEVTKRGIPNIKQMYYNERAYNDKTITQIGNLVKSILQLKNDKVRTDSDFEYIDYATGAKLLYNKNPLNMDVVINSEDVGGGHYMTDYAPLLEQFLDSRSFNFINARAGAGKTTYFTELATKKQKKVLLVMPYTAPMDAKFGQSAQQKEIDEIQADFMLTEREKKDAIAAVQAFQPFSGSKKTKEMHEALNRGVSSVITFDKFSRLDVETLLNYDYISIDEIHVMATETIRSIDADSVLTNALKLIRETLLYKKENPDDRVPYIIGMTGTPTYTVPLLRMSELDVTQGKEKIGVRNIKLSIPHHNKKELEVLLLNTNKQAKVWLCKKIADAIMGRKSVICPTDEGSFKAEEIICGVNAHLEENGFEPLEYKDWHYYKRATKESTVSLAINNDSVIPDDIQVLFCSVYLSVGVDIKNLAKNKDIEVITNYTKYTAQSLEQFGNRLRKQNIKITKIDYLFQSVERSGKQYYTLKRHFNNDLDYKFLKNLHKAVDGEMNSRIEDDRCVAYFNHYVMVHEEAVSEAQKIAMWADLSRRFTYSWEDFTGEIKVVQDNMMILRYVAEENYNRLGTNIRYIVNMFRKHYDYDSVNVLYETISFDHIEEALDMAKSENDKERKSFSVSVTDNIFKFIHDNRGKDAERFIMECRLEVEDSHENTMDFVEVDGSKKVRLLYPEKHHKRLKSITNKLLPIAKQYVYTPENFALLVSMCMNKKGDGLVISELERFGELVNFKNNDFYDHYVMIVERLERLALARKGNRMSKYLDVLERSEQRLKKALIKDIKAQLTLGREVQLVSSVKKAEEVRENMLKAYEKLSEISYNLNEDLYEQLKNDVFNIASMILMNNSVKGLTTTADYNVYRLRQKVEENIKTFFVVKTNGHNKEREVSLRILPNDYRNLLDGVVKTFGNKDMKINDFEQYLI